MFNLQFIKSIIDVHSYYKNNNFKNELFLNMIDNCFGIKKTTFYDWVNNEDITNAETIYENNNKLINPAVEVFVVDLLNKNNKTGIKNIKKQIKDNFKISINNKSIFYILFKNNIKYKNIKAIDFHLENRFLKKNIQNNKDYRFNEEHINFILKNKNEDIKNIIKLFYNQFKINIHQKQIVNLMNEHKIKIKSFFKSSPKIVEFILKSINDNKIYTVKQIKDLISTEYHVNISTQLIYNILKKNNYVYKKFKFNNNPYSIKEQVEQFKEVIKIHNKKNINNCVSIDEISFVLDSKPSNGWFKKGEINEIKCNNKKIIRERYSLLVASNNNEILQCKICKKGVKSDFFIDFMKELNKLNDDKTKYYLLDNARVHKSKKFNEYVKESKMKMVYNAPYHSETNPIENIFSMFRNYLNRNKNGTEEELLNSINEFKKIDNKEKYKNIFNHSCNLIEEFILKNEDKNEKKN